MIIRTSCVKSESWLLFFRASSRSFSSLFFPSSKHLLYSEIPPSSFSVTSELLVLVNQRDREIFCVLSSLQETSLFILATSGSYLNCLIWNFGQQKEYPDCNSYCTEFREEDLQLVIRKCCHEHTNICHEHIKQTYKMVGEKSIV